MTRPGAKAVAAGLYMALCYAFIFLPVGVLVLFSFQAGNLPVPPLRGLSLRWYAAAFNDGRLVAGFGNSLLVGGVSSALSVLIGFLAAFGLARYEIPGKALLRAVIMLPLAVSYLLVGMGLLVSSSALGLGPSLVTVMIAIARYRLPNYAAMITFSNLGLALVMVIIIAGISSYIGIRKVLRIEPFDIFRG